MTNEINKKNNFFIKIYGSYEFIILSLLKKKTRS